MASWKNKLFLVIVLALVIVAYIFRDTMAAPCIIMALVQGVPLYVFKIYEDSDLKEQFDDGKNIQGWQ